MTVGLTALIPAAEEGWWTLFELSEADLAPWLLVGGQMIALLAAEHGVTLPRTTADADVVVDLRARPGGTEQLARWLTRHGFDLDGPNADGIGHRFVRPATGGPGQVQDPVATAAELGPTDRRRLRMLAPLSDRAHVGWMPFDTATHRRGAAALAFLLG